MIKLLIQFVFVVIDSFGLDFSFLEYLLILIAAAAQPVKTIYNYISFFIDPSTIVTILAISTSLILIRVVFAIINLIYP